MTGIVKSKEDLLKWFEENEWGYRNEDGWEGYSNGENSICFSDKMFEFCETTIDLQEGSPFGYDFDGGVYSWIYEWFSKIVDDSGNVTYNGGDIKDTLFVDGREALLPVNVKETIESQLQPTLDAIKIRNRISELNSMISEFLIEKNKKYGNSALEPITIFSKHLASENPNIRTILVRIDDKLKRISTSEELRSNDVIDLLGYIELLVIGKDWDNEETITKHME